MMKKRGRMLWISCLLAAALSLTACGEGQREESHSLETRKTSEEAAEETKPTEREKEELLLEEEQEEISKEEVQEEQILETKIVELDFTGIGETYAEGEMTQPLKIRIESKEENGIDWAYEWYDRMSLSLPMMGTEWNQFYDDHYIYKWVSDGILQIADWEDEHKIYYEVSIPTDKWYVNGNNAYLEDGILYAGSIFNGYATENSCFMFAYDLQQDRLLWRSADQTYNSMNFIVKGDVILCGYGFTDEKDYIYQLDKNTGRVLDRLSLYKMPDLLVEKGGKLYVHTYSYDYVLSIE